MCRLQRQLYAEGRASRLIRAEDGQAGLEPPVLRVSGAEVSEVSL